MQKKRNHSIRVPELRNLKLEKLIIKEFTRTELLPGEVRIDNGINTIARKFDCRYDYVSDVITEYLSHKKNTK